MTPSLRPLHPDETFSRQMLDKFERVSTEGLIDSLLPGRPEALKARPDGTIMNGHHRVRIFRDRGVDALPREIVEPDAPPEY